jgi:hypothetical protein
VEELKESRAHEGDLSLHLHYRAAALECSLNHAQDPLHLGRSQLGVIAVAQQTEERHEEIVETSVQAKWRKSGHNSAQIFNRGSDLSRFCDSAGGSGQT